jgi:hypothetical protein
MASKVAQVRIVQAVLLVALLAAAGWGLHQVKWGRHGQALVQLKAPQPPAAEKPAHPAPETPAPAPETKEHPAPAEHGAAPAEHGAAAPEPKPPCPPPPCPPPPCTPVDPCRGPGAEGAGKGPVVKTEAPKPWPNAGPGLVDPIVILLAREKQSFWGYRLNDLVVGKILDNGTAQQQGEIDALRPQLQYLAATLRPAHADPVARMSASLIEADLGKYWLTSGETQLDRGIKALQSISADLAERRLKLPADPDHLREIVLRAAETLKTECAALAADTGLLATDNRLYHARGVAIALDDLLAGAMPAMDQAVEEGKVKAELRSARGDLAAARAMDPWLVLGRGGQRIKANHLARMAASLEAARASLDKAAARLAAPPEKAL